jgi:Spy/CpxP family protein refolding chaperone
MKRTLLNFAGVSLLAAGMALGQSTPAPTAPHTGRHSAQAGAMLDRLSAKLNLTNTQKQQAQSIFSAARQSAKPVRAQLRQERQALQAAVKSGAPDAQIDQLANQMGPLMAQATAIHSKAFAKFYSVLTPEQRTLLGQRGMNRRHAG